MSRRSITELAIDHPLYVWILALACILGGLVGVDKIARLEDPPYPIKQAYIFTQYPGASAEQVEHEVTEVLEASLQELPWVEKIISRSVAGRSEIQVELLQTVSSAETPQIWDIMRRRVSEAAARLPAGASAPAVEDDFSDVYGILYAVNIPDGYEIADVKNAARLLQTQLKLVKDVAKVQLDGIPEERVYIDFDYSQLLRMGLSLPQIVAEINAESRLNPAAPMLLGERRFHTGFVSPAYALEPLQQLRLALPGTTEMIQLTDIATIERKETELPPVLLRHNGQRVFTVGVSINDSNNVAQVGLRVEQHVRALEQQLPAGMSIDAIYEQHTIVDESVDEFLLNLLASIFTVIAALCVFMGWRAGVVVGAVLLLTVLGTLALMTAAGIQLHRISLGAMMIAMGMLVDNAIVVAEGMITGIQRGLPPRRAAVESVENTRFPLLGATIIGIAAFAPIGLSSDSTGQYLGTLFQVSGISLLLSWVLAIAIAPAIGLAILKPPAQAASEAQLYSGRTYRGYAALLRSSLRWRWFSALGLFLVLVGSLWGMGQLKQGFFPTTNTPLMFIDVNLPQGTDIQTTTATTRAIEELLQEQDHVTDITSWIGRGPTRFTMIILPERPNPAYSQVVARVSDIEHLKPLMQRTDQLLKQRFPGIEYGIRRIEFTSGSSSKLEARFSGPDAAVLRQLAQQSLDTYLEHGLIDRKIDWRQQELTLVTELNESRARQAGVTRTDISNSLAFNSVGIDVGMLRDQDKLIPIVARAYPNNPSLEELADRHVWSTVQQQHIPLRQMLSNIHMQPDNGIIIRRNRTRTITAQANPAAGETAAESLAAVRPEIEALPLPPGYHLTWGGEYEANAMAEGALGKRFPIAMGVMVLTTLLMFGRIRQTLVVWLTVPMILCGIAISLNIAGLSFTFPAVLGLLSLVGILIKNCIIMVEEIDHRMSHNEPSANQLINACISRLRPVMLAAGTTIAGMSPLLADSFFREMAVTIMGGLAFGSVLALVSVPLLYGLMYPSRLSRL